MRYLSEWCTPERRRLVLVGEQVRETFAKYRQTFSHSAEAGGVLLGKRRGEHLEITLATEPTIFDRRTRFRFERAAQGHAEAAQLAWLESKGTVDYVGEWHTHPQRQPAPSRIDRFEWSKLTLARPNVDLVVVIVGTESLYLEIISTQGQTCLVAFDDVSFAYKA
ncbi:Mov34/MPN/PAD-1 family protein [Comamonas testosteroni]|uniref:Mov34/MPN/PAD-1 family protein n=1 Tax=Comamonas testosteroni TaxID=285 RepID=UPI0026F139C5|nr:Mov34/MPN/PAD-1 family protein [Comamonas testosteroni]